MEENGIDMKEEGLDLHELYAKKVEEMKEKYADVINEISVIHGVPLGDAFDMLKAVCRGGNYADNCECEFDLEELKADYFELCGISEQIAKANGLI